MAKGKINEQERALFRQAVKDAKPLDTAQPAPYRRRPPPVLISQPREKKPAPAGAPLAESEVETYEFLFFSRSGLQKRILSDLQRGRIPVELILDLHGLTSEQARETLDAFLTDCQRRRVRCAQVIHGKGYRSQAQQPVLKRKVNYWLRLYPEVLAFCSATRRDGGTGALYVLLKNPDKRRTRPNRRR